MNVLSFMNVSEVPATVGGNIDCIVINSCPNLRCTKNRNLSRAVYHKIRSIRMAEDNSSLFIDVHPFYEEENSFTLRDLLMVNSVNDVQINLAGNGGRILLTRDCAGATLFAVDSEYLYRNVRSIGMIEGVLIVDLAPSIEEIVKMIFNE